MTPLCKGFLLFRLNNWWTHLQKTARERQLHHSPLLTRMFSGRSRSLKLRANWRTDCTEARSSFMNSTGMDTHIHTERHTHQSHSKRIISASGKTSKSVLIISYSRLGGLLQHNAGSTMLLLLRHIISNLILLLEHHQSFTHRYIGSNVW